MTPSELVLMAKGDYLLCYILRKNLFYSHKAAHCRLMLVPEQAHISAVLCSGAPHQQSFINVCVVVCAGVG